MCAAAFQALFEKLIKGASAEDRKAAAQDVVTEMKQGGAASFAVRFCLACCYLSKVSRLDFLYPHLLQSPTLLCFHAAAVQQQVNSLVSSCSPFSLQSVVGLAGRWRC